MQTQTYFKEYQYFLDSKSDKSPLTIKSYTIICGKFFDELGIDSIEKLGGLQANEIRSYIMGLKVSANTKNGVIRVLKLLFSWMYKNDYLVVNQMLKIDKQKTGKKILRMPTIEEMDVIYSSCENKTTSLMINLMSKIGLRRCEIVALKVSDIYPDFRIKVSGKGNKEAVLKISEALYNQIIHYIEHKGRKSSEYIFSYDGHAVSTTSVNQRIKDFICTLPFSDERQKAISPHSFRHRAGTNVYNKTGNPYAVKAVLRHSDISIGQIYIHPLRYTNNRKKDSVDDANL